MRRLVLVVLLATVPSQGAPTAALSDYMSALGETHERWERIARLTAEGKTHEAWALGRRLPPILVPDSGASDGGRFDRVPHRADARAWAEWSHERALPVLEARLYRQASEAGLVLSQDQRQHWFRACAEIGDLACVARLGTQMVLSEPERGQLEALAAGTLTPAAALRARRALSRPFSRTLALERWALPAMTPGDRVERLAFVRDVLQGHGRRLANEALIADPALPPEDFVDAAIQLASGTDPEEASRYWELVASNPRVPDQARGDALRRMGLLRREQGRPADADHAFRRALSLEERTAATAFLIAHGHFGRGDYEAALSAYRDAEARHWRDAARIRGTCGHWDPEREAMPYVLYQGVSLERLGRLDEAMAEYASVLLDAPRGWRRPLALHVIEMYDAAGRLHVLERFLEDADKRAAVGVWLADPPDAKGVREILSMHLREKRGDWRSLAAELAAWDLQPSSFHSTGKTDKPRAAAHALARHCDEALPLLPPAAISPQVEMRPWANYTRELCARKGFVSKPSARNSYWEAELPEVIFPHTAAAELPDPIVRAPRPARTVALQVPDR